MKHCLLYIFAVASLASCSKSSELSGGEASEGKVRFAANIPVKEDDWGNLTRGVAIGNDNITHFGVFCFNTGRSKWSEAGTTATPNKMFNVEVLRVGQTAEWTYNPPVEWHGGDGSYFSFFGYSPRATGAYDSANNTNGNNIELISTETSPGVPTIGYTTLEDVTQQIDLLLAKPVKDTPPVDKVTMQFTHALSQIRFKAWSAQQGTTPLSIAINGIKYKGTIAANGSNTAAWTADAATANFKLEGNFPVVSTNAQNMTDLSAGDRAFMLLPQDLSGTATTATIVIAARVAGTEKTTTYTLKENWQAGKSYTYTVNMGGNPTEEIIISGVTITDWQLGSEENMETNPPKPQYINPPTPEQYMQIGNLYWAKGNLVASFSPARGCKVGAPMDYGLYFQFGSLIGWSGGSNGTGVGAGEPALDKIVWPAAMGASKPDFEWQSTVRDNISTLSHYFFNYTVAPWNQKNQDIRTFDVAIEGDAGSGTLATGRYASKGVGDPCTYYLGEKWRLPTTTELLSLTGSISDGWHKWSTPGLPGLWATAGQTFGGVTGPGAWFGPGLSGNTGTPDPTGNLFFLIPGYRNGYYEGAPFTEVAIRGYYWSSTIYDYLSGFSFTINDYGVVSTNIQRLNGMPVRCVSENPK